MICGVCSTSQLTESDARLPILFRIAERTKTDARARRSGSGGCLHVRTASKRKNGLAATRRAAAASASPGSFSAAPALRVGARFPARCARRRLIFILGVGGGGLPGGASPPALASAPALAVPATAPPPRRHRLALAVLSPRRCAERDGEAGRGAVSPATRQSRSGRGRTTPAGHRAAPQPARTRHLRRRARARRQG